MNPQFLKGVKTLNDASKALKKVSEEGIELLNKYTFEKLSELTAELAAIETKIANLTVVYTEKKRQADVDLKLSIEENQSVACNFYAENMGFVFIEQDEYTRLQEEANDVVGKVNAAVGKANAIAASNLKSELAKANFQHEANIATINAQLDTSYNQINFLEGQVRDLRSQLDTAQNNIVLIAQAGVSTINVEAAKR